MVCSLSIVGAGAAHAGGSGQAAAALLPPQQRMNGLQMARHLIRTEGVLSLYRYRSLLAPALPARSMPPCAQPGSASASVCSTWQARTAAWGLLRCRGFGMSVATFVPTSGVWWGSYGAYQKLIWPVVRRPVIIMHHSSNPNKPQPSEK